MAHERIRHSLALIRKLAALWPAIGIIGPRQCGKSTLLRNQVEIANALTLDDEDQLDSALRSAKVFISRLELPIIIDEIQKAPALFDALKAAIDRKRRPGQYYLTGSSQFSARIGVQESLTGRIGLLRLYPLTLAEIHQLPFRLPTALQKEKPRISVETWSKALSGGGMPMPVFLRDSSTRMLYWEGWTETTVYRDLARLFKRNYDPRISMKILRKLRDVSLNGDTLQADDFIDIQSRTLERYLSAFEEIFVLRRITCHEKGVGKDHWMAFDSGFLSSLFGQSSTDGATLSLARTLLLQELSANLEYGATRMMFPVYFKSTKGSPIDLIWDGIPIKVITSSRLSSIGWEERALAGAIKTLGSKIGLLYAPVSSANIPKSGVGVVPWGYWS